MFSLSDSITVSFCFASLSVPLSLLSLVLSLSLKLCLSFLLVSVLICLYLFFSVSDSFFYYQSPFFCSISVLCLFSMVLLPPALLLIFLYFSFSLSFISPSSLSHLLSSPPLNSFSLLLSFLSLLPSLYILLSDSPSLSFLNSFSL